MKLKTLKTKLIDPVSVPGLLSGGVEYQTASGVSRVNWTGPKIPALLWEQVLVFFMDTFERTKAECQVRLYVNTRTNTWAAWAYPQYAAYSMAVEEVADHPDRARQREQFKDEDGWLYIGTAHHHCSGQAFQSGTDRKNEENQDGLHITIGKLDSTHYDIHARFYFAGMEFDPDMSQFWDVGEYVVQTIPAQADGVFLHDAIARHQMTTPAPAGTEYPIEWRANIVEKPAQAGFFVVGGVASVGSNAPGHGMTGTMNRTTSSDILSQQEMWLPESKRKERALEEVKEVCRTMNIPIVERDATLRELHEDPVVQIVHRVATKWRLNVFDVAHEWDWEQTFNQQFPYQGES